MPSGTRLIDWLTPILLGVLISFSGIGLKNDAKMSQDIATLNEKITHVVGDKEFAEHKFGENDRIKQYLAVALADDMRVHQQEGK